MIVVGDNQSDFAVRLAQRIITAQSAPFPVAHVHVDIGATIGIALRSPEHSNPEASLHAADIAMYRAKLRFDKIKIDRSFVMSMHDNEDSRKLVDAIIGLGKSRGLPTTAEGIETEDDASWLGENGCAYGQGYLFGKAIPAAAVSGFLHGDEVVPSKVPLHALAS
jgi:predicted signal transduction protein with EAL and GGDEF domain